MNTSRSAFQEPFDAVREVIDQMVRPGLEIILVDAACASSLYSVALGVHALETNRADAVIAGGVFCPGPGNGCLFSQFRGTTSTGCRPFDANADGVVFSEGAAVVALRRVADAERLGLPIQRWCAALGFPAMAGVRQPTYRKPADSCWPWKHCYRNYGIDPASIHAIEGHGTSTPVGDSTEVETLRQFFSGRVQQPIMLHSLKGLLGHAGWAAGTASIIAAFRVPAERCLSGEGEPSRSVGNLGSFRRRADRTETRLARCRPGGHRIAIDGFGFGGSNAHVVLDSYAGPTPAGSEARETLAATQDDDLVCVAGTRWLQRFRRKTACGSIDNA